MTPVICLITDRRRFGAAWERALIDLVGAAARAGVHLIQIRERDLEARVMVGLVSACLGAVRGTRARVIVNERLDVALAAEAHGVHLRGDSMSGSSVRRIAPRGFLIGRSVHATADAVTPDLTASLDYLIFGTVFETRSKAGVAAAGVEQLASVTRATTVPVLAVGGMSVGRSATVASTGAAGIAAIGLFADVPSTALPEVVRGVSSAFDMPQPLP